MRKEDVKNCYILLDEMGEINSDHLISSEILCEIFGESDTDSWDYIGPLLYLINYIQKNTGLFCKSEEKGIRIFSEDDAYEISKRRGKKASRITEETKDVLLKTNLNNISSQENRQKHIHQINLFITLNKNSKLILEQFQDEDEEI